MNRVVERVFFAGMALLLSVVVVFGFGHAYFFAGMMRASLPSPVVHVHAAVMTLWMVLFVTQTALVSARRVAWHRTLGIAAFCLPLLMVPLGIVTGLDELRREVPAGQPVSALSALFFAESILGILLFAVVIAASWRARRKSLDAHKRLAVYATIGLASGALIRIPWSQMGLKGLGADAYLCALALLLLLVVGYDLLALRRIHTASMWAAPLTFAVSALTGPVSKTETWHALTEFLARTVAPHV